MVAGQGYIDNYKEENKAKAIELKTPESAFSWLMSFLETTIFHEERI